jgi:threonine dehydrogenase-like Zn-dependent dehydrogenase
MIAVQLDSGEVRVAEVPTPPRPRGFALIRMLAAGICNTDLELRRGYYAFSGIPGHEFTGIVVDADSSGLIGKRVAGEINLACGHCDFCAVGLGRHCRNRTVLGIVKHPGAFAEFLTLPESNLHLIPNEIATEQAIFIEPLAAACEILEQVKIAAGERVAVLGDGKLGLLVAQALHAHGAHVTLYGRHEEKLRFARAAGIQANLSQNLPRSMFPFVVDATGSPEGLRQAVSMVQPRGTLILKSTVHGEVAIDTAPVIVDEITLVGSRCGRFEPAIELLRTRKVNVGGMIAAEYPLEQAPEAFAVAGRSGVLKVLLRGIAPAQQKSCT